MFLYIADLRLSIGNWTRLKRGWVWCRMRGAVMSLSALTVLKRRLRANGLRMEASK